MYAYDDVAKVVSNLAKVDVSGLVLKNFPHDAVVTYTSLCVHSYGDGATVVSCFLNIFFFHDAMVTYA